VPSSISQWRGLGLINDLWDLKINWNGIDLAGRDRETGRSQQTQHSSSSSSQQDLHAYRNVMRTLLEALSDYFALRERPHDEHRREIGLKLSPEAYCNQMHKPNATIGGTEETKQYVGKDRL
jgi:hypothetical protein